jgi:hypothetical protein
LSYIDPQTIHNPSPGGVAPASWGDVIRQDLEFLIDPPACSVFNNAAQTVATGTTGAALTANSENFDNNSMHSTATNTSRITAQTAGRYLFLATVNFANNATGLRNVFFRVNGVTDYPGASVPPVASGNSTTITGVRSIVCAATDYVECWGSQTSGGNLSVTLLEFVGLFFTR